MRFSLTLILVLSSIFTKAQTILDRLNDNDIVPKEEGVIYGNFIQRLGFSSGGFPQDIVLVHLETKELFKFRVKPTFKSSKENTFCYALKPGTYAILTYLWTKSQAFGGTMYTEPIYDGVDSADLENGMAAGELTKDDLKRFRFTVESGTLHYVGAWHFETGIVFFEDDKNTFDVLIKDKYRNLDVTKAKTSLPYCCP